ncbi:MAG TPA: hypothetical protein VL349_04845 [Terriglobales bacterium]|jgi:hypothetical protein|nr:hypothetical protein [Terriglobales bacterium]
MAVLSSATDAVTRRLPKLVSPEMHRSADYLIAGVLIAGALALLRKNRRAAYGSLACGGSLLGLSLTTRYPGRGRNLVNFSIHGKAEIGMAFVLAALPEILRLEKWERQFFAVNATALTALANLTDFHRYRQNVRTR